MVLRSRFLPTLTNAEAEAYLKEKDAILVPVGTVEMHGGLPMDCETVIGEAIALEMAERADCLVLPGLMYFYAGATASGRGTVQVSIEEGVGYLKAVTRSLLRQGFRRIVFLSLHGPAHITLSPVARDMGDVSGAPILYIDAIMAMMKHLPELAPGISPEKAAALDFSDVFNDMLLGAYLILGRLEDVPLTVSPLLDFSKPHENSARRFDDIGAMAYQSGGFSYHFKEQEDHAPTFFLKDAEDRLRHARRGAEMIKAFADRLDAPMLFERLGELASYNAGVRARCGEWLRF